MGDQLDVKGPKDFDYFHELIILDEFGRCGSGGVLWGLLEGVHIGLPPVLNFGSDDLRKRCGLRVLKGEATICLCITEPYAGSDVANIRCTAKKSADGTHYVVDGEKKWITNGVWADYFTVGGSNRRVRHGRNLLVTDREDHARCDLPTHGLHGRVGERHQLHHL
jgi:alkylation response protein AidB-like acyl-CoA dehydrogenase